jgi:hypothetical protein
MQTPAALQAPVVWSQKVGSPVWQVPASPHTTSPCLVCPFRAGLGTRFEPTGCGAKPAARPEERWIAADDELRAMRQLLRELRS